MITIKTTGDFKRTTKMLDAIRKGVKMRSILDKYGHQGVELLRQATPIGSGTTASSWNYTIEETPQGSSISFNNTNINKHVNIAIILDTGHGTRNGGWVEGRHYIEPTIQPLFDEMVEKLWKEVTKS